MTQKEILTARESRVAIGDNKEVGKGRGGSEEGTSTEEEDYNEHTTPRIAGEKEGEGTT